MGGAIRLTNGTPQDPLVAFRFSASKVFLLLERCQKLEGGGLTRIPRKVDGLEPLVSPHNRLFLFFSFLFSCLYTPYLFSKN